MAESLPPVTYRVVYWEGFGWPECTDRRRAVRRFDTAEDAARLLEEIARLPDHHKLIGVWVSACRWERANISSPLSGEGDHQEDN
jgi:hypothetical protein